MRRDQTYLRHIRDAARRIQEYTHDGRDAFMENTMMQDAVIRNLEIIGEATKGLSTDLRERYPDIPWSSMAGMRDVLIHGYMGVDLEIVWDVVASRIGPILSDIERLLREIVSE